jgi:tripartite-type tricarboxylate transporter receptor subunit TctC
MQAKHKYVRRCASALLAITLCSSSFVYAQNTGDWPNKTIKVVVPYTPGGSTDTATRVIMDKLSARLKQNIVIENKPGANGNVGAAAVARAEPDGYTFVSVLAAYSISPHLYQMPFAPDALVPISKMADLPLFLFVSNKLPVTTVQELVTFGKNNPGKLNYASSGTGASAHMTGTNFGLLSGLQMEHVPYKGSAPILADILSGQLSFVFDTMVVFMPHVKEGKLKAIAVSSAKRWPTEPNIPTMAESGFPGFAMSSWVGLMAPKGTPAPIIDRISKEIGEIVKDPDVQQKFLAAGFVAEATTPEGFRKLIEKDGAMYGEIVKKANIKVN